MREQIVSLRGESGCERRGNLLPLIVAYSKTAEGDHHVFHSAKSASFNPRDDTQDVFIPRYRALPCNAIMDALRPLFPCFGYELMLSGLGDAD